MKTLKLPIIFLFLLFYGVQSMGQLSPGDSLTVQCFDFEDISERRAWFEFPEEQSWHKILMYYTIKCDPQTPYDGYACGEWDYTTFTHIYHRTGLMDSTHYEHPYFISNGTSPDSLNYGNESAWNYFAGQIQTWEVEDTTSLTSLTIGDGLDNVLAGNMEDSRCVFLYSADDLSGLGLTAGTIQRLKLHFSENDVTFKNLSIRISHSDDTDLSGIHTEYLNGDNVYFSNSAQAENGQVNAMLYPGFDWDGSSSVIIDLSWNESSVPVSILSDANSSPRTLVSNEHDKYLDFNGSDYLDIPAEAFNDIDQNISICMWIKGDENIQPQNDMLFEAYDADLNRVMTVHLPWSNGNVYWDCGNDGTSSYDRIDQACSADIYKGSWNHWAFVKDGDSDVMEIYLNGELWHSGSGKTRSMAGIEGFYLGGDRYLNPGFFYDGDIDDFQIFNAALDETSVSELMQNGISESHPNYGDLILSYNMNETDYSNGIIHDLTNNGYDAIAIGMPQIRNYEERFRGFEVFNQLPQMTFEQGEFTLTDTTWFYTDSVAADLISLQRFEIIDYRLFPVDTQYVYSDYYSYSFSPVDGSILDSAYISADNTIHQETLHYYSEPFDEILTIQLQNFVTPYGINLDLGDDGFSYVYDVTEYAPFLHDSVDIQAHNTQELLDLKFVFISGTPVRDLISFNQLWRGTYGQHAIAEDEVLPAVKVKINENTAQTVVRTRTTGHGMDGAGNCAEFCPTIHNLYIDNVEAYSWQNWTECSTNPVYPQGGTWIFDRAGWCPGAFADTYNWDISESLTPGDSVDIDYGMEQYPLGNGEGQYRLTVQLIEYGEPNFVQDAAIDDILKPSNADRNKRFNPICGQPEVKIQNTGADTLRSLTIEYGIDGTYDYSFNWTGELNFMEKEDVLLPAMDWREVIESDGTFNVRISSPNGGSDEFEGNNAMNSQFEIVPVYENPVMFVLRTNNVPDETSYEILNGDGEVIKSVDDLDANTTYYDTIPFEPGCYDIRVYDSGDDGLSFWFNSDAGSGSAGIRRVGGTYLAHLGGDFGRFVRFQFVYPDSDYVMDKFLETDFFDLYPNPTESNVTLELKQRFDNKAIVQVCDIYGKTIQTHAFSTLDNMKYSFSVESLPKGMYMIRMVNGNVVQTRKLMVE